MTLATIALTILLTALYATVAGAEEPSRENKLPTAIDLRPNFEAYGLPNRCQGARGTCSVFAVTGGIEYAYAVRNGTGFRLSIEFLNWAAHRAVNRSVDGGFFSELWKGYETSGICLEEDLPYRTEFDNSLIPTNAASDHARKLRTTDLKLHWIKEWNPEIGLTPAHVASIKQTIAKRWPVLGGFRWPKKLEWQNGLLAMCPASEVFDGHSVMLVGFKDDAALPGGGAFIIRNSGGDGSDGLLSYTFVSQYMNDAAWVESAGHSPLTIRTGG